MELKKQVFAELDRNAPRRASWRPTPRRSTSTRSRRRPRAQRQVIGHPLLQPGERHALLEIVRGKATSPTVIATSMALAKR